MQIVAFHVQTIRLLWIFIELYSLWGFLVSLIVFVVYFEIGVMLGIWHCRTCFLLIQESRHLTLAQLPVEVGLLCWRTKYWRHVLLIQRLHQPRVRLDCESRSICLSLHMSRLYLVELCALPLIHIVHVGPFHFWGLIVLQFGINRLLHSMHQLLL